MSSQTCEVQSSSRVVRSVYSLTLSSFTTFPSFHSRQTVPKFQPLSYHTTTISDCLLTRLRDHLKLSVTPGLGTLLTVCWWEDIEECWVKLWYGGSIMSITEMRVRRQTTWCLLAHPSHQPTAVVSVLVSTLQSRLGVVPLKVGQLLGIDSPAAFPATCNVTISPSLTTTVLTLYLSHTTNTNIAELSITLWSCWT